MSVTPPTSSKLEPFERKTSINSICIYTLTVLAIFYTAYLAQDLILLLLVAGLISLLLSPGVKALERLFIPRVLGSTLLLSCLLLPSAALIIQLEEPVTKWTKLLPELSVHVSETLEELNRAIDKKSTPDNIESQEVKKSWFSWFEDEPKVNSQPQKTDTIHTQLKASLFSLATDFMVLAPLALIQLLTTIILILFTLVYSPKLFRQYVKLFVTEKRQRNVFKFALNMQQKLSRYILTVSVINIGLSLAAIIIFTTMGLEDALLWGLIVGFVNFIPFVGPSFALAAIAIAGSVQWGVDIKVLLTLSGVLALNILESQLITPLVLAKNMRINPFIIIIWLLITGWLWGLTGLLIAVPLLVCIKLVLAQFKSTSKWVKFLATQ
ncbi:AI-2E family transporter [Colwellia sp. D2M02]|uniref:AI-2E family transporter n=1 Tax=Colwellia sp. D2M02 TaxID=2841562 RepID=UPI001C0890F6|nr:AI-2E family transporter [Colwellia sp. D2M02]MBU2894630.1 AI-2E family transporter [Colwellia sp. D2M02]